MRMKIEPYFEQQGSGSPIVFIHGSYATTSTWKKMIGHLAESNHCISIKLPGHCGTPDPVDFAEPSIETELCIVGEVVRQLTHEPIHLVGHSFGGVVALAQALKGDINLHQMTLFEPVATWVLDRSNGGEMASNVQAFLAKHHLDMLNESPRVCGHVIDFWGGENTFNALPDFIQESMTSLVKNNIRHWNIISTTTNTHNDLNGCNVPTRLVYGDESNPVSGAICTHLNKHLPNSNKYIIEGASHFLVTSHADDCLNILSNQSIC